MKNFYLDNRFFFALGVVAVAFIVGEFVPPVLGLARALAYAGVLRRRDGAKGAAGGAPRRLQGSVSS